MMHIIGSIHEALVSICPSVFCATHVCAGGMYMCHVHDVCIVRVCMCVMCVCVCVCMCIRKCTCVCTYVCPLVG